MNTLKQKIIDTMPINVPHILYIYDEVGKILFNNNIGWKSPIKIFNTTTKEECSTFLSWVLIINLYNIDEKTQIFNFIFQEVFKSLNNSSNIEHLKM